MMKRNNIPHVVEYRRSRRAAEGIALVSQIRVGIFKRIELVFAASDLFALAAGMLDDRQELSVVGLSQLRIQPQPAERRQVFGSLFAVRVNRDDAIVERLNRDKEPRWRKRKPG
ncbi:MAG TPA: hypothetical protein VNZ93_24595 [Pseudorhodoplanes sp.]|nr:hypothetical protein [Pseudorhodoplanes sp.]